MAYVNGVKTRNEKNTPEELVKEIFRLWPKIIGAHLTMNPEEYRHFSSEFGSNAAALLYDRILGSEKVRRLGKHIRFESHKNDRFWELRLFDRGMAKKVS